MGSRRIDYHLVDMGLVDNVEEARIQILIGNVLGEGRKFMRTNELVKKGEKIQFKQESKKFVSRGGEKLEPVLKQIGLDLNNKSCLDVGASTGGFTDCLLQNGADKVITVDVASGFLAHKLCCDERVLNIENCNLRVVDNQDLTDKISQAMRRQSREGFALPVDLIVGDVSFISWQLLFENLLTMLKPQGKMLLMFKPQFEIPKAQVPEGGVVVDQETINFALKSFSDFLYQHNVKQIDVIPAGISGSKGNQEYFFYLVI